MQTEIWTRLMIQRFWSQRQTLLEVCLRRQNVSVAISGVLVLCASVLCLAQSQPPKSGQSTSNSSAEPVPTFRVTSRIVTLEVIAKDQHGQAVPGLKASDFQVFEQELGWRKEKREQKVAFFREVDKQVLAQTDKSKVRVPEGIYTNLVSLEKNPVPPTILLVDGLNTELSAQMQVHAQMVKMLNSLPGDVPVAVYLMGRGVKVLQGFTTDPTLLKTALSKAAMPSLIVPSTVDPRDDPDSLSTLMGDMPQISSSTLAAIQGFEQEQYASSMDWRVRATVEALISVARHVAGYPGRKNLLWISSSFPIVLNADASTFDSFRTYQDDMRKLAAVLADAKVAVYPIDPEGVSTSRYMQAGSRNRSNARDALARESMMRFSQQATMDELAQQTGGSVCISDNDLGDCVKRAIDDSSAFYEMAYYPDAQDWSRDFRKIIVKTNRPGVHLAYRQGYFTGEENHKDPKKQDSELLQAACEDYLNATSILFAAKILPPDSPENLKFYLAIDPTSLTFVPTQDGGEDLKINVAVCTFDKAGKPLHLMRDPIDRTFSAKEYNTLLALKGLPHIVSIPGPKPAAVRLLVKDFASGRVGSINVRVENLEHPATAAPPQSTAQNPTGAH